LFEIVFLGTSASAPSARRGLSAQVVKHNEHRFLIDCGEGTQRQILQSGIGFKSINRILLTHGHLDHILGLGGLMSTFIRWESIESLEICAGKSVLERVKVLVNDVVLRGTTPPMMLSYREITPGIIYDEADFTVSAIPVTHRGPDCLGYVFEEKPRRPFLPEVADALGVPFGHVRSLLVNGETITLENGSTVGPEDVLGPEQKGTKLVVIGDTGRTDDIFPYVQGANALVIESTYIDEDVDMARQFSHMTAKGAAELAVKAGVDQLLLTHISRRYREKDVAAEAQAIHPNAVVVRDFDTYQVKKV
jgi:ribonuclease Z